QRRPRPGDAAGTLGGRARAELRAGGKRDAKDDGQQQATGHGEGGWTQKWPSDRLEGAILREVLQSKGQFRYIWRPSQVTQPARAGRSHRQDPRANATGPGHLVNGRNPTQLTDKERA